MIHIQRTLEEYSINQVQPDLTTNICGLSEHKAQHLYTFYIWTQLIHCSPVIPCTPTQPAGSYDLSGQGTGT